MIARKLTSTALFALVALLAALPAAAHEFILKQDDAAPAAVGKAVPVSILSAHVFMESVELEGEGDAKNIAMTFHNGHTSTVPLSKNESALTWDATVTPDAKGAAVIAAHRKPMIWTQTTKGWVQASKKGLSGVLKSGKYEKFAKALVPVGGSSSDFGREIGQRLEIVPAADPFAVRPGGELPVRVLFDGKPLCAPVSASFDGFTTRKDTYAYITKDCDEDGILWVKLSQPGLWMIRAEHTLNESTPDYDTHVMRSVLTFRVR